VTKISFLHTVVVCAALSSGAVACAAGGLHLDGTTWAAHHRGSIETIAFHNGVADIVWDMTRMSVPYRAHGPHAIEVNDEGVRWVLTMNPNGQLDAVDPSGAPMHFVKQ
jgi:hypothetical protein